MDRVRIDVAPDLARAALRLSFGCLSDEACIDRVADVMATLAAKSRGPAVAAFD